MQSVSIAYLGYQAKTKNEMYHLLTTKAKLYLSPGNEFLIYFIRDLLTAKESNLSLILF